MSELYNVFFPQTRSLARTNVGPTLVSTVAVSDSVGGFETAIADPRYNNANWIIVAHYHDEEQALLGHVKWCEAMKNPPEFLKENGDNYVLQLVELMDGVQGIYPRQDVKTAMDFDLVLDVKPGAN